MHLRGRGEIALHLDLATSAVARRAFSLLRELGIHSEIRTYSRRSFDRATRYQLHVTGDEPALAMLVEAGVLDARHAPGRAAAEARRRPRLLPRRLPSWRAARRRLAVRARAGRTSSCGRPPSRAPSSCARSRPPATSQLGVLDRGRHAVAYAKGLDSIEAVLSARGRGRHRPRLRGALGHRGRPRRGEPARERRPRQSRPHEPRRARTARGGALAPGCGHARAAAGPPARDRRLRLRHPTLPLRELAARCEPPTTKASAHRRLRKLQELATR